MNIWESSKWKNILDTENIRSGVRLKFDNQVDPEVRRSCKEFVNWLRKQFCFPLRVPVYIKSVPAVRAMDGDFVTATFFEPYDYNVEPYIRIATGDYAAADSIQEKDNALASILHSVAHELTHYFQWINGIKLTERGYERQAARYAGLILDEYAETREHP